MSVAAAIRRFCVTAHPRGPKLVQRRRAVIAARMKNANRIMY